MTPLPPGATIGIIGGGQLGRMLALAAAQLGYRTHIFDPDPACCAGQVAAAQTIATYDDRTALAAFAGVVDVVTYEFENVDADPLEEIASRVPLFPPLGALRVAQDRIAEKQFAAALGARTAPWAAVATRADLDAAVAQIGLPAILKTTRFGYDGKGQVRLTDVQDSAAAWDALGGAPAILEGVIAFDHEFSVLVARGGNGTSVTWDPAANVHDDGILATSSVPAPAAIESATRSARDVAIRIADALNYVGVLAVEFFASTEGPVVNELAPRVHNSGHWTIEGAVTSQFENHVRAICGLPLGDPARVGSKAVMHNLIGAAVDDWPRWAATPRAHLHLYGKGDAREGRKMGHVTLVD